MKLIAGGLLVLASTSAFAAPPERHAELLLGNNMVVIHLSTNDNDPLNDLGGDAKKGVVRCYTSQTKVHDTGCYVGIKRDGTLVAPAFLPKGKPGDASPTLIAFAPALEGTYTATDATPPAKGKAATTLKDERLEIDIGGTLGAAISLYATCSKGPLTCQDADGEAYRHGQTDPVARFSVGVGGKVYK